ncbi:MAG: hypothetical protein ABSE73_12275 [Planctomycetota bacterium]
MTHQGTGLDERGSRRRKRSASGALTARVSELLNTPASRKTPLGIDTAWALKLKATVDHAARELEVQVHSAKPICVFDSSDPNDMLFELETERGRLHAMRSRSGAYTFKWLVEA